MCSSDHFVRPQRGKKVAVRHVLLLLYRQQCKRYFQLHFCEWKHVYLDKILIEYDPMATTYFKSVLV